MFMRRKVFFAILIVLAMRAGAAYAHGVVGDYVFLEPLITEDPTPANELDIAEPSWTKTSDGSDYAVGFEMEKVLYIDDNYMPRFRLAAVTDWHHLSPDDGPSHSGLDNLEIAGKWAPYYSL